MTYEEIKVKVLECMVDNDGYRPSDIGYYVFGAYKVNDGTLKISYSPQAHSMMIGKHLKKMKDEKILYQNLHEQSKQLLWYKREIRRTQNMQ